jgi:hypothetical protein
MPIYGVLLVNPGAILLAIPVAGCSKTRARVSQRRAEGSPELHSWAFVTVHLPMRITREVALPT